MATGRKAQEYCFEQYLNDENKIFVKFVFGKGFQIDAFVVSLISIVNGKANEIIRFDGTKIEKPNVHRFYNKPQSKEYIEMPKSFETIEEFIENIKENWVYYRLKYEENYN